MSLGLNDLSQAWMMGSKWTSEMVWSEKFILALERKTSCTRHLQQNLACNPRRYKLYFDMVHFNDDGMRVVARTLYHEIDQLGWWNKSRSHKK